jgi:hypothetical protein
VTRKKKRPWFAALCALIYPGAGHLYLREWLRAFLWFAFAFLTAYLFIPPGVVQAVETSGWSGYVQSSQNLPWEQSLPVLFVSLCNILDAYWSAVRNNRAVQAATDGTIRCPHCGRKVDDELDFCQWCTSPLETDATVQ